MQGQNTAHRDKRCRRKYRIDQNDEVRWLQQYYGCFEKNMLVLDLGCGYGANIDDLLSKGVHVTAADASKEALESVKSSFHPLLVDTVHFDMRHRFPLLDHEFDVIVADLSLHYGKRKTMEHITGEMCRVLKPDGRLIARVNTRQKNPVGYARWEQTPSGLGMKTEEKSFLTVDELLESFSAWNVDYTEEKITHCFAKHRKTIIFTAKLKNGSIPCGKGETVISQ